MSRPVYFIVASVPIRVSAVYSSVMILNKASPREVRYNYRTLESIPKEEAL
jgi:hypothetical protein